MAVTKKTTGWIGIGFSDTGFKMVGSDAVIGWVDGSGAKVTVLNNH